MDLPDAGDPLDTDLPVSVSWIGDNVVCRVAGGWVVLLDHDTGADWRLSPLWFLRRQGRILHFRHPESQQLGGWDGRTRIQFADTATAECVARRMRGQTDEVLTDAVDLVRLRRQSWEAAGATKFPGWAGGLIVPRMLGRPALSDRELSNPPGDAPALSWQALRARAEAFLFATVILILVGVDIPIAIVIGGLGLAITLGLEWISERIGWDFGEE